MLELIALFSKPRTGAPMQPVSAVSGRAGHGLVGDASADPASPRHVLLVAAHDLQSLDVTAADLRANLVVRGELASLASGAVVSFGSLALRLTIPCEACAYLDTVRPHLAREIGPRRGVLARVLSDGVATLRDRGELPPIALPALSSDWRARVHAIVLAIPPGRVLTYAALARAAGVQRAYIRALPSVLRALAARGAPVERIVPASRLGSVQVWDAARYYAAQEAACGFTGTRS